MIYDAFAHLPIYGLEDLGFVGRGEAGDFIAGPTSPPAANYRSTPMAAVSATCIPYVRHVRIAGERAPDVRHCPPQLPDANISVCHGGRHVRRLWHDHHVKTSRPKALDHCY
jgi:hypothetical protein